LDLFLLLGGRHFTFLYIIFLNRFTISTYSLIDTGANGFAFINRRFAQLLYSKFGWKVEKLPFLFQSVKRYNSKQGACITSFLRIYFIFDRRKIYNVPFLVLSLGSHDIIIGKSFIEYFEISPNVAKRILHWLFNYLKTSNIIF
jgi:predicted aspartyl protease